MMNSPVKNSVFTVAIVVLIITLGQHVNSHGEVGVCSKPCTGGPADLCVACASNCVKTCADPSGGVCIPECNENACECINGFLRAPNGQCVLPFQCPKIEPPKPQCPVCTGGIHDRCVECGTDCPLTCANPNPQTCTARCNLNVCECEAGYVRAPNGQCVLPEQCPVIEPPRPQCPICTGGIHDRCVECGTDCPRTCKNPNPQVCTLRCKINVCECEEGYVRAPNGQCILPCDCPIIDPFPKPDPKCPICTGGPHDHCTSCGSSCAPACGKPTDTVCPAVCLENVCQCDAGYVRGPNNQCILRSQCPRKCHRKKKYVALLK